MTTKRGPTGRAEAVARKNKTRQSKDGKLYATNAMFPNLHNGVLKALNGAVHPEPWFHESDTDSKKNKSTNIMGKFKCLNKQCSKEGWTSNQVAILIRGYADNGYNAVVFNQRCKLCNTLGALTFDKASYIDRVVFRLKVWADVPVERPPYNEGEGPPHESELCEGCKAGYCKFARNGNDRFLGTAGTAKKTSHAGGRDQVSEAGKWKPWLLLVLLGMIFARLKPQS